MKNKISIAIIGSKYIQHLCICSLLIMVCHSFCLGQDSNQETEAYQYLIFQPNAFLNLGMRFGYGREFREDYLYEFEAGYRVFSDFNYFYTSNLRLIDYEPSQYLQARLIKTFKRYNYPSAFQYYAVSTTLSYNHATVTMASVNELGFSMLFDLGIKFSYFKYVQADLMFGVGYFKGLSIDSNYNFTNSYNGSSNHDTFDSLAFRITARQCLRIKKSWFKKR